MVQLLSLNAGLDVGTLIRFAFANGNLVQQPEVTRNLKPERVRKRVGVINK